MPYNNVKNKVWGASDAVKWQISTLSTKDLANDEQKVLDYLNKASDDIAKIK